MPQRSSIQRRLPAFVTAMLGVLVLAAAYLAYGVLGRFAIATTGDRLLEQTHVLAMMSAKNSQARLNALAATVPPAAASALADTDDGAAAARSEAAAQVLAVFAKVALTSTVELRVQDRAGRVLLSSADSASGGARPLPPPGYGPFVRDGTEPYFEVCVVVHTTGGEELFVVERRRMSVGPEVRKILTGLFEADSTILFGNASGDVCTDLGLLVESPPSGPDGVIVDRALAYRRAGAERLGALERIENTPWVVGVELPQAVILAPMRRYLVQICIVAAVLLAAGAAGAWFLGRRITRPLVELTDAADAIASGARDRRVRLTSTDEIGRLGRAFDVMADRVELAQRTLEERVDERTRQLKDALASVETANAELEREVAGHQRTAAAVRSLNDDLAAKVSELQSVNRELETFSYSVSHDLRAPLRAIAGFSAILIEDHEATLNDEVKRCVGVIRASVKQMETLIDDLLDFSRLSRASISKTEVELDALVEESWAALAGERSGRQVDLRSTPLPRCLGDRRLLKQVVLNLLSNALKYSRPRSPAVIEVGTFQRDGDVVCFVKDNGVGFDMQHAAKLFGVFQRLHRADEFEGTGVGLALCERILARHGFRIWAESAPGSGATFFFTVGRTESRVPTCTT